MDTRIKLKKLNICSSFLFGYFFFGGRARQFQNLFLIKIKYLHIEEHGIGCKPKFQHTFGYAKRKIKGNLFVNFHTIHPQIYCISCSLKFD